VGELISHDFVPFKMLSAELRRKRGTVGTHVFVDGFTAILLIRPVPSKAQIGRSVVYFKRFVETQTGRPVKLLRSDFENINLVDDIRKECDNTGTKLQASAPYRKEQNGLAERGRSFLLWLRVQLPVALEAFFWAFHPSPRLF
jgi:hypothetical protein